MCFVVLAAIYIDFRRGRSVYASRIVVWQWQADSGAQVYNNETKTMGICSDGVNIIVYILSLQALWIFHSKINIKNYSYV